MSARRVVCLLLMLCVLPVGAVAGGPLVVGGPGYGKDGQPFTWNPAAMPIRYRVDPGPMSVTISNAAAMTRIQGMFAVWQGVPTAAISLSNAGPLLPAGSYAGGDVNTAEEFDAVMGSCKSAAQNPVILDADGTLVSDLGVPSEVIGVADVCAVDSVTGYITGALVVMNGKWQDGVNSASNWELTANEFDEAIAHEIGHFMGLHHSQINLDVLTSHEFPCDGDGLAGLPLMFPIFSCEARKDAGLPTLSPDDVAWISKLYPGPAFATSYGTISGTIYFSDGISQVQGANVIARLVDDPNTPQDESRRVAVSGVSGYLFTDNPGQSISGDNSSGSQFGSRNPQRIGYYEIAVPPGTYTVEVESVNASFDEGSGVGPFNPPVPLPGPAEFWNSEESAFDFPLQRETITVHAGDKVVAVDIIVNWPHQEFNSYPRFDQYEDSGGLLDPPWPTPLAAALEVRA